MWELSRMECQRKNWIRLNSGLAEEYGGHWGMSPMYKEKERKPSLKKGAWKRENTKNEELCFRY